MKYHILIGDYVCRYPIVGGISELHKIASIMETYDVGLAPHSPLEPIALAAYTVAAVVPNCMSESPTFVLAYDCL